jgi:hypothetical protein
MKRIKIFKAYFVLWLFVYFIAVSNLDSFKLYFLSTLTFNIAIVSILMIGTIMIFKGSKDLVMMAGTFGVLMYKKRNVSFYIKGIEKILPSTIAIKIQSRVEKNELLFTQQEKEDILGWIGEKFANQNKYNNFFIGTVLMIGLLGTFSGLLGAIGDMGSIVMSLAGSNVDIGKIMAGFSGPLSSMAVGFGSSLFGVISAILLSIKGYLLNKSQESLLDGVENWLNAKTLESASENDKSGAVIASNTLENHNRSFTDVFIDKISLLTQEMENFSSSNRKLQEKLSLFVDESKQNNKQQENSFASMQNQLLNISINSNEHMQESIKSGLTLRSLLDLQGKQLSNSESIKISIDHLSKVVEKVNIKESSKVDNIDEKIELFQILESIDQMRTNMQRELEKLKEDISPRETKKSTSSYIDFMSKHFKQKPVNEEL